jgi:hypothetical protein
MSKSIHQILAFLAVLLLGAIAAEAGITGSISGTVKDPSGAVVPDAEVSVTEVNTGVGQTTHADSLGTFSFLALPVGRYRLDVKRAGFEAYQQQGIQLDANDALRFDIQLKLGQATQSVQVTTGAVHVETISTQSGDVIGGSKMEALPLNGRNFTDLLGLQPGVAPISAGTVPGSGNFAGTSTTGNVSISGQRESANGFVINGGNVEEDRNNSTAVIPNLDSISEFRVLTNAYDAEYGYYAGGVINVVTKSGTNEWHGDGFEFLRNTHLDARNFYDTNQTNPLTGAEEPGTAIGAFRRNQFGGTLGGRVIRDKLFFFVDYQGTRQTRGLSSGEVPVPTPAERAGDFSALAGGLAGTVNGPYFAQVLSQRLGYTVASGEPYFGASCASSAQCVFPNGMISQSALDPASKNLLQFIPQPNAGAALFVSSGNNQHTRDDRGGARIDYDSRWGMLSGYYAIGDTDTLKPYGTNNVPGFPTSDTLRSQQFNLGLTSNFRGVAVNEFRFNFTRLVSSSDKPLAGVGPGTLKSLGFAVGVPGGITPASTQYDGVPSIGFNNFGIGAPGIFYQRFQGNPEWLDNFSIVRGAHTLKMGAQDLYSRFIQQFPLVGGNGFISFGGFETGSDFADFLIGAPTSFVQESSLYLDEYKNYLGLYAQDSWRAKPNLTLNYGLRWDYVPSWAEGTDQKYTYALGQQSTVFPTAPRGVLYVGDTIPGFGKIPRTLTRTPHGTFAPRVGLAYSPSASGGLAEKILGGAGKTSIRASYGLFYTNIEGIQTYNSDPPPPFVVFTVFSNVLLSAPYTNRGDGVIHPDPFPFVPPKPGQSFDFTPLLPIAGFAGINVRNRVPYSENFQFNIQRQLGSDTLVSLGYVGSQAHHLLATIPINPGDAQLCLSLSNPANVEPGGATCGPFGEDNVYTEANGTRVFGTRSPFSPSSPPLSPNVPNIGDNTYAATIASSTYNAFQASVRHTTGRLGFLVGYTYSKSMDNSSGFNNEPLNFINQRASRSLSNYDLSHNFVVSYNYLLPFDRLGGHRWPRLQDGWQVVGITRFTTGLPITIAEGDDGSLLGTFGTGIGPGLDTPNYLGGAFNFTDPRSGNPYFNAAAFRLETLGVLGNSNKRFFHGPGLNNWDLALLKDLKLTEKTSLEFRGEFFNIFNHAQFNNPDGNINHGTFGLVTSARDPRIGQVAIKVLF